MNAQSYDIAILGAGPVGQVLALLLARLTAEPARIALFAGPSAMSRPSAAQTPAADPRVLAMNHGSRVLLEHLQAWPRYTSDIRHIHVSQRGRLGRTVIDHQDFDVPYLGSVVPYVALQSRLAEQVKVSGITVLTGPAACITEQNANHALITQGDHTHTCHIAVQCDGAGGGDVRRDYDQHAIITSAHASLPRLGWAWERFTREGPLAMLPHPETSAAYSVVWCCAPAHARALTQLSDHDFSLALTQAFGDRLGRLKSHTARHVFPLELKARHTLAHGRLVTIGNAAQTLHPVAGQGLNLGLRDAAQLARALQSWLRQPRQHPATALAAFTQTRQADRWLTAGLTDFMPRVFATGLAPVEHMCGLTLLALDLAAPLRAPLARHLLQGLRT